MKTPKERIIFSNYDVISTYREKALDYLRDCDGMTEDEISMLTDDDIYNECFRMSEYAWEDAINELSAFLSEDETWVMSGKIGAWHGTIAGGITFGWLGTYKNFKTALFAAIEDCDYAEIKDCNGHLYLKCSHHDGTNFFEIKKVRPCAYHFLEEADEGRCSLRESELHVHLKKYYSTVPNFVHSVWGAPQFEYIED